MFLPVSGKIIKILIHKDEIAKVGEPIAILEIEGEGEITHVTETPKIEEPTIEKVSEVVSELEKPLQVVPSTPQEFSGDLYLSPLVKSIAEQEGIWKQS
jgi:2-oxoglutarate dehydrogenase E2 component (dihydrolipoamide succinyltransferase)